MALSVGILCFLCAACESSPAPIHLNCSPTPLTRPIPLLPWQQHPPAYPNFPRTFSPGAPISESWEMFQHTHFEPPPPLFLIKFLEGGGNPRRLFEISPQVKHSCVTENATLYASRIRQSALTPGRSRCKIWNYPSRTSTFQVDAFETLRKRADTYMHLVLLISCHTWE